VFDRMMEIKTMQFRFNFKASYIGIFSMFAILLAFHLSCGSNEKPSKREPSISEKNKLELRNKIKRIDHYLIQRLDFNKNGYYSSSESADIFVVLTDKTWSNPNDTKSLILSVDSIVETSLPINYFSIKFICSYYDISVANITIIDTAVTLNYKYEWAKEAEKEKRRTEWKYVDRITVRGVLIKKGDLADDVYKILKPSDRISEPYVLNMGGGNLKVTQHYKVGRRYIDVTMERILDPGPYRVTGIKTRID